MSARPVAWRVPTSTRPSPQPRRCDARTSPPFIILPARRKVLHISLAAYHASRNSVSRGLATHPC
eukprot:scaffold3546_cov82-Isochrysis_galbana.AAC.2